MIKKKYIIIIISLIIGIPYVLKAQVHYKKGEYGFGVGLATYFGDLNQGKTIASTKQAANIFLKHNYNPYIAIKLNGTYAVLNGSDHLSTNNFNKQRNLNFTSLIWELNFQTEFNFLNYTLGDYDNRFSPYISLGIGAFNYNPYTFYNGQKHYLKPLGTEGQNFPNYSSRKYSGIAMSIPIGFGVKYWVASGITAALEITNRFSTTDYIDDVSTTYVGASSFPNFPAPFEDPAYILQDRSPERGTLIGLAGRQRGIGSTNDQYITAMFSLSVRFKEYICPR
jgi:hypothetical protein